MTEAVTAAGFGSHWRVNQRLASAKSGRGSGATGRRCLILCHFSLEADTDEPCGADDPIGPAGCADTRPTVTFGRLSAVGFLNASGG